MAVEIRPYVEADFAPVTSIWFEGWASTGIKTNPAVTLRYLQERLPQEITGGWNIHVAVDTEIIGFVAMQGRSLVQLFILPALRGRGVGKRLLDFIKETNPDGFWLDCAVENHAACRFYERQGLERGEISTHSRFGFQLARYHWAP